MKKILSVFICAALLLSLCACGRKEESGNEAETASNTAENSEQSGEMVYTVDIFHMDSRIIDPLILGSAPESVYVEDMKFLKEEPAFYETDMDGKIIREMNERDVMQKVTGSPIWGLIYMESRENREERYVDFTVYSELSGDKQQLLSFRVEHGDAKLYTGLNCFIIMTAYWDEANNGYYQMQVYNTAGELIKTHELYDWYEVHQKPEGIYLYGRTDGDILYFDESTGELLKIDQFEEDFSWAGISNGCIYMFNDESYFRRKIGSTEREVVYSFEPLHMRKNGAVVVEEGKSFITYDPRDEFNPYKIIHKVDKNSLPKEQKTITLAVNFDPGWYYNYDMVISAFSIENKQYEIKLKNYFDAPDPEEALGADIASGEGPDIIDLAGFKGSVVTPSVCEDLMPYIERDMGEDFFMKAPLNAMKSGDKLLSIAPSFKLIFLAGPTELLPENGVSSWGELAELAGGTENVFGSTLYREDFMLYAFSNSLRDYSAEQVAAALSFAACLPLRPEPVGDSEEEQKEYYDKLSSGEIVDDAITSVNRKMQTFALCECTDLIFSGGDTPQCRDAGVAELEAAFGAPYSVSGLPMGEGGSYLMRPCNEFAIMSGSQNKEGAWEFIKILFQDQYLVSEWEFRAGIPLSRSAYELHMDTLSKLENTISIDDREYTYDYHRSLKLYEYMLNNISAVCREGDEIFTAVNQLAESYFAGDTDLETVSADIASRIKTYNAERG